MTTPSEATPPKVKPYRKLGTMHYIAVRDFMVAQGYVPKEQSPDGYCTPPDGWDDKRVAEALVERIPHIHAALVENLRRQIFGSVRRPAVPKPAPAFEVAPDLHALLEERLAQHEVNLKKWLFDRHIDYTLSWKTARETVWEISNDLTQRMKDLDDWVRETLQDRGVTRAAMIKAIEDQGRLIESLTTKVSNLTHEVAALRMQGLDRPKLPNGAMEGVGEAYGADQARHP